MEYRLLAFDLDGTLLNAQGHISEANRAALLDAMSAGIHVCICTGRAYNTIPEELLTFPGIEYAVANNGSSVYRIKDRCKLHALYLEPSAVERIVDATAHMNVAFEGFIDGEAYADAAYIKEPLRFGATPRAVEYVRATRTPVDDMRTFLICNKNNLESMDIIAHDAEVKRQVISCIRQATDDVYITSSVSQLVEISNKYGGKRTGLKFMADYLGINADEIMAFGDADNDIDMLEFAGCGIAMENATDTLKEKADYVTHHHDEDGVAHALRKFGLGKK